VTADGGRRNVAADTRCAEDAAEALATHLAESRRGTSFAVAIRGRRNDRASHSSIPIRMRARIAALAAFVCLPVTGAAQAGGYGPLVLQLPASTRAIGFGNAYVAVREAEAVFYNPANAGGRNLLAASVERYGSEAFAGAFASAYAFGPAGVGIGAQLVDYHVAAPSYPSLAPNGEQLMAGGPFHASSLVATMGLMIPFKGIRWGVAAKVAQDRVANGRDGVLLADVGAAKEIGPVSVGLSVQNLGTNPNVLGTSAVLPTRATLGFAGGGLPVGPVDFAASAALSVRRGGRVSLAGGGEFSYMPIDGVIIAGRLGARVPEADAELPITMGASFTFDRVTVDYAFEPYQGDGSGHRVGLRIR